MGSKVLFGVLIFVVCIQNGFTAEKTEEPGNGLVLSDAVPFLWNRSTVTNLLHRVFAVQAEQTPSAADTNKWKLHGSGFFVESTEGYTLGVTCAHVVSEIISQPKQVYIGMDTENGFGRGIGIVVLLDNTNDIAVLLPQKFDTNRNAKPLNFHFAKETFDDGMHLAEGKGLLIAGYPLGMGNEGNQNRPILRFGMVAQRLNGNTFLIDGMANHGNSGSPVFMVGPMDKLVGMVTSFHQDLIPLFDEKGKVRAMLPHNSGLSRAVSISSITAALNQAKANINAYEESLKNSQKKASER
jgi:hypothetical protein